MLIEWLTDGIVVVTVLFFELVTCILLLIVVCFVDAGLPSITGDIFVEPVVGLTDITGVDNVACIVAGTVGTV